MRIRLAEKLLVEIMEWTPKEVGEERALLQALSNFKYNEYQQFSIGTLFIESLVKWLNQFETLEEKKCAYRFLKRNLIFFSNTQMLHLVNTTYTNIIEPILVSKTAAVLGVNKYCIAKIIKSDAFKEKSRSSLYIGLSDGAKIDILRRTSGLNNEQVIPTYEVNDIKVDDMLLELSKSNKNSKFETIFLVDDFSASGTSYFREENGSWKGKVYKTIDSFFDLKQPLSKLVDINRNLDIHLIFYIATEEAKNRIENLKKEALKDSKYKKLNFNIHVLQIIDSSLKERILKEEGFIELSKKYIDSTIIDRHFEKAKHELYYLGYDECCLPVVLGHNTPNNSLPLLWWTSESKKFVGLFPRITRHS